MCQAGNHQLVEPRKSGVKDFKHMVKDMKAKLALYKFVDDTTVFEVC